MKQSQMPFSGSGRISQSDVSAVKAVNTETSRCQAHSASLFLSLQLGRMMRQVRLIPPDGLIRDRSPEPTSRRIYAAACEKFLSLASCSQASLRQCNGALLVLLWHELGEFIYAEE